MEIVAMAMVVVLFKFNVATSIAFFGIVSTTKNYMNHMKIDFKSNILKVKWFTVYAQTPLHSVSQQKKTGREKKTIYAYIQLRSLKKRDDRCNIQPDLNVIL